MFGPMEFGAFMWNCSHGVVKTSDPAYPVCLYKENGDKMFARQPYVCEFVINEWKFSLVSLHLKCRNGGFANKVNDTVQS